jgi:hypothetical protein
MFNQELMELPQAQLNFTRREGLRGLVGLSAAALLPACGGGGGAGEEPRGSNVRALEFRPAAPAVGPGLSAAVQVIATRLDGSSADVTSMARWQSNNAAVVSIREGGWVTGISEGSAEISATVDGFTAAVRVRVGNFVLGVEINSPFRLALGLGGQWATQALLRTTLGSAIPNNRLLRWTSSNTSVATVVAGGDEAGLVHALAAGETTITGSADGVSASYALKVLDHQLVRARQAGGGDINRCLVCRDGLGRALAVWCSTATQTSVPDLGFCTFVSERGWSGPQAVRVLASGTPGAKGLSLAMSVNGRGTAAWFQPDGLYVADFTFAGGWQSPQRLVAAPMLGFEEWSLLTALDDGGTLLVWNQLGSGAGYWSARRSPGVDWETPEQISTPTRSLARFERAKVVANRSGQAVLMRAVDAPMSLTPDPTNPPRLMATRRINGVWGAEEVVSDLTEPVRAFDVTIDDTSEVFCAWGYTSPTSTPINAIRARVDGGWQTVEQVVARGPSELREIRAATRAGFGAVVVWVEAFVDTVAASVCDTSGRWQAPKELYAGNVNPLRPVGTPMLLPAFGRTDGGWVVSWRVFDFAITGELSTCTCSPAGVWATPRRGVHVGRVGAVSALEMAWRADGTADLMWQESNQAGFDLAVLLGYSPGTD